MITKQQAEDFARHWINAWNDHNIEAIMEHYAYDIKFYSPVMITLRVEESGRIKGKTALKAYFLKGLAAYPDLNFEFRNVYYGVNSIVVHYISVNDKQALEVFELDEAGKVLKVQCNYLSA